MSSSSDDDESLSTPVLKSLNISNDQYYEPVINNVDTKVREHVPELPSYGSKTIRHSLPAYDLWRPFFPTYPNNDRLRNFHRPKLRHYNTGPQTVRKCNGTGWFPIKSLSRNIVKYRRNLRSRLLQAINRGCSQDHIARELFTIKKAYDLTAKHGELVLFEYSEEHPPILCQLGMCVNVKIYTCHSNKKLKTSLKPPTEERTAKANVPKLGLRETIYDEKKARCLYFTAIKPGSSVQMIECNLFRAPIFEHSWRDTDFLVVRTRNSFYIRGLEKIYTVGQVMPLAMIPCPSDFNICRFRAGLSNFYINMQLLQSDPNLRSLDFERLLKLFPDCPRASLYKRLRKKGGQLKSNAKGRVFVFPDGVQSQIQLDLNSIRTSFTPEQYCLSMTTLASRQRLRELNYTESMINPPNIAEVETEVLAAPWNTSSAVMKMLTEKSFLDLKSHLIDPTGPQKEGFSCVVWHKSPTEQRQLLEMSVNKTPSKVPSMTRSSSQQLSLKNPLIHQIRREKLERLSIYNREAQLLSEVQSKVLASKEELSSDEEGSTGPESSSEEENLLDKSFQEQLHDLDRLVISNRSITELSFEKEEEERQRMLREFHLGELNKHLNNTINKKHPENRDKSSVVQVSDLKHKILRITRTYNTPDGLIRRTEIVREPKIIALYVQQRGDLKKPDAQFNSVRTNGDHNESTDEVFLSSKSRNVAKRSDKAILGPSELCRADGMRITISKRVLDPNIMRQIRRASHQVT